MSRASADLTCSFLLAVCGLVAAEQPQRDLVDARLPERADLALREAGLAAVRLPHRTRLLAAGFVRPTARELHLGPPSRALGAALRLSAPALAIRAALGCACHSRCARAAAGAVATAQPGQGRPPRLRRTAGAARAREGVTPGLSRDHLRPALLPARAHWEAAPGSEEESHSRWPKPLCSLLIHTQSWYPGIWWWSLAYYHSVSANNLNRFHF